MKRMIILALLLLAAPAIAADLTQISGTQYAYLVHGSQPRPWGHEVGVAVFDTTRAVTDKKDPDFAFGFRHVRGLTLTFKVAPDEKTLNDRLAIVLTKVAAELAEPVKEPEKVYSESEIVSVLVSKKYLTEGQKLEDLPENTTADVVE